MTRALPRCSASAALLVLLAVVFDASAQTAAQAPAAPASAASASTITITGKRMTEDLPADKPVTVIGVEGIDRRMAENVFDILKGVPGVGVEGGPRTTGMKFSLRGFTDNEDVMFKIDGAVKGFEKYRFGSGVLLDPELVNAISVERGPAVTSGSGALGGTISATTKSAIDLLRPGESWGALTKFGWNDNNGERLRLVSVFGRPGDFDLLAAIVRRDSHDITLADGSELVVSATHSESRLAKIGWFPHDRFNMELGYIQYLSGPERQPYDATGGVPSIFFGNVRRTLDDATTTLRLNWDSPYGFKARGVVSRESTYLEDEHRNFDENGRIESRICVNRFASTNPRYVARCHDTWHYDISNAEVFVDASFATGGLRTDLTVGVQGQQNRRDTRRTTSNELVNADNYPGGFNADQPAGDKVSSALIGEAKLHWADFTLTPGLRRDRYTVSSRGQARTNMQAQGQNPDIGFSKALRSLALTWQPGQGAWSVTGRINEGFRPPLIDEYFGDGSVTATRPSGRCRVTEGDPTAPGSGVTPDTWIVTAGSIQPLYDPAGIGLRVNAARDLAPASGICGDLYKPQESVSRELMLAWKPAQWGGYAWSTRLTLYRIRTDHLLSSLQWVNGTVGQPGVEHRQGVEFEGEMRSRTVFASLSHGRVRREGTDNATNGAPTNESFQVPADVTVLTLGTRIGGDAHIGWRVRHLSERRALAGGDTPAQCISNLQADGSATQNGVTLNELFGQWQISRMFGLRASVDNLDNRDYCGVSSFSGAVGFRAPGRSARVSVTAQF